MKVNDANTANTGPDAERNAEAASSRHLSLLERIAIALQTIARAGRPEDLADRSGNGLVACQLAGHADAAGSSEQGSGDASPTVLADFQAELAGELAEIKAMLKRQALQAEPSTRSHYSVDEAAELTGYTAWTIRQACNKNRIKAHKGEDGRWRIPRETIAQLQEEGLPAG